MRRLASLVMAAALTSCWAARAAEPVAKIVGPSNLILPAGVDRGTLFLDARGSVSDKPLRWKLTGPDTPYFAFAQEGREGVALIAPAIGPGTYQFQVIARGKASQDAEMDADAVIHVVTVERATPTPVPTPTPTPTPDPTPDPDVQPPDGPVDQAAYRATFAVTYIYDNSNKTVADARMQDAPEVMAQQSALNFYYGNMPNDPALLAQYPRLAKAAAGGLPVAVIQSTTGGGVLGYIRGRDPAAIVARIKKLRGMK